MALSKEIHEELYYKMVLARKFEETATKLFTEGKVHGPAPFLYRPGSLCYRSPFSTGERGLYSADPSRTW